MSKNTANQVITAGKIELTVEKIEELGNFTEPMGDDAGLKTEGLKYQAKNTDSNLPVTYSVYVYAKNNQADLVDGETKNTMDINLIKVDTGDGQATKLTDLDSIQENDNTYYKIGGGTIEAGQTDDAKTLKLWVSEALITDELDDQLTLGLYVVSEVNETE